MFTQKIGFIGGGNMAQAIIGGLIAQGFNQQSIMVSEPYQPTREILQSKNIQLLNDNVAVVQHVDIIIIAVKPQMAKEVLAPLTGLCDDKLIISIMAGIEIETISQLLGGAKRIVRVMPNTPALLQLGASGAFAHDLTADDKNIATQILQAIGLVVWVKNEREIDAVTAISGSGPAYFFYMMEQMIQAGIDMGLDEQTVKQLTLQTALGSAQMAMQSEYSPTQLRKNVTSPNGTTQKAIETFDELGVGQGIQQGVKNAERRSQELAEILR
ncbi:pyrroline-5-carboxylate reductase [Moraxella sp. ZY210820]|uniref:pyrroline-5-carboxylate reductase n=1 Tax=unclassified Moraxella TaxID=2685852 RepID=UPI0027303FB5|nr:pyrroline-5-carboxylate reductase [Moraxella sp. ZY210820]WLF83266.1 pyrroline-5-carboxylate reductase [Moraxella sp. ZY210820]